MNAPASEQQAPSLNDELAAAFDEMESSESTESVEEEITDEQVSEEVDEEITSEADEEVSGEEEEESDHELTEEEETEAQQELNEEIEEAAESDFNDPAPERWPDEIKNVYNSLPPEGRQAMLEGIYKPMQASYTQATQEISRMRDTLNPMMETLHQHRNTFERMGVDATEVFRTQLAWAAHLQQVGPEQGLRDMAAAYGVTSIAPQEEQVQDEYLTPFERQQRAQLNEQGQQLQGLINHLQGQEQSTNEQALQSRYNEVQTGLQTFINETKDGRPAHPHVEKVAPAIAGIMRGGLVKQVDDYGQPVSVRDQMAQAYEMAVRMDPTINAASSATRTGQVRRTKRARSVDVVSKSPNAGTPRVEKSLQDDLSETFDSMAG